MSPITIHIHPELAEKLLLVDGARRWIDRVVRVALLRAHGDRGGDDQCERRRTNDEADARQKSRHDCSLRFLWRMVSRCYDAMVSRYAVCQPQAPEP